MDEPHREVCGRPATEEWESSHRRARRRLGSRLGGIGVHALQEGQVYARQPPPSLQEVRFCGLWPLLREEVPPAQPIVQTGASLRVLLRAADVRKPGAALRLHQPAGVKVQQQQPVGRRG